MDPVNGDDSNNGAAINSPVQTITAALDSIVDNSATNRYIIVLFPGGTVDPETIIWKPYVSMQGWGRDVSVVRQSLSFVGTADLASTVDFTGLRFEEEVLLDQSAAISSIIRFIDSRVATIAWSGGGPFTVVNNNELAFHSTNVDTISIFSGAVRAFDSTGFFTTVNITDQQGLAPFLQMTGGTLQGTVNLHGGAQLFLRGVDNTATFNSTATIAGTPVWETDSSSMIVNSFIPGSPFPPPSINGDLAIRGEDQIATTITTLNSPFNLNVETYIRADATLGPIIVNLPPAGLRITREVIVKKLDPSDNPVTVTAQGIDIIDGSPTYVLATPGSFVGIMSVRLGGTEWDIIRRG